MSHTAGALASSVDPGVLSQFRKGADAGVGYRPLINEALARLVRTDVA
jgi:hypothetical protein